MLYLIWRKRRINCICKSSFRYKFHDALPGNIQFFLSLRAWELNFNHGEMACVDNCITGFLRLRRDLKAYNRPWKIRQRDPHWEGCLCVGPCGGLTSSAFVLYDDGGSDKLSNVNTATVQVLTLFFLSLSNRDLKIENLLLDEQDNIKLIGNTRAPTFPFLTCHKFLCFFSLSAKLKNKFTHKYNIVQSKE